MTVSMRSTKRQVAAPWQPNEIFRHSTRRRRTRPAWLLVCSTHLVTTKRHSASSSATRFAQKVAALLSATDARASSTWRRCRAIGLSRFCN